MTSLHAAVLTDQWAKRTRLSTGRGVERICKFKNGGR